MSSRSHDRFGPRPQAGRVRHEGLPAVKRSTLSGLGSADAARKAARAAELAARTGVSYALAKVMVDMENVVSAFPPGDRECAALGVYHDADGVMRTRHQMLRAVPSAAPHLEG